MTDATSQIPVKQDPTAACPSLAPGDVAGSKQAQNQSQPVTGPRTGGSCGR